MTMPQHEQPQTTVQDDPQARALLKQAFERTARWQADFKGFTADLTVNVNGKETSGSVMVKSPREVSVQLSDPDVQKWAQEQISMIAGQRPAQPLDFAIIGNGRVAALLDRSARIVWWCFPRFDGDPVFSNLLAGDEEKGFTDIVVEGARGRN